jgi:hypothetical protein
MSDLITLHQIRQDKGIMRQPSHEIRLLEYDKAINSVKVYSPYDPIGMKRAGFKALAAVPGFIGTSLGRRARIPSSYIYRVTMLHTIVNRYAHKCRLVKRDEKKFDPARFKSSDDFHKIFTKEAGIIDGRWTNLAKIFESGEHYQNPRGFSFWTDTKFREADLLEDTFQIGYASDWLKKCVIILRCEVSRLSAGSYTRIPTVLDAFTEPIFMPMDETDLGCDYGVAINIKPDPLSHGFNEYVIGPIALEHIEITPVVMKDFSLKAINFMGNIPLWEKLQTFYSGMA